MILVTGGTGLVGSHLLYHLSLNYDRIRAIHTQTSDLNAVKKVFANYTEDSEALFNKIRWVEADLNNIPELEVAFDGITRVYHCAALVSFVASDYHHMRRVNIEGTTNIVNLCIAWQVEKLCYVSSVAAIEKGQAGVLVDETDNWNSENVKSGYAITKYGAEMEVWRASQEGIPVVIVNPGVILGSGFWHKGSGKMFSKVNRGLKFYTEGITGFVGVQDVVHLMQRLMDSNISNERYILVAQNLSFKAVLTMIAQALDKEKPRIRVTKWMGEIIWRLEYLRSKITLSTPLLTKYSARSSVSNHPYDASKIKKELDFEFEDVATAVQRAAKHFKT